MWSRVRLHRKLQDLVGGREGFVFLLTVCEPCRHSWALRTTVVLGCSCSVPLDVKVVAINDPFIPLAYSSATVSTGDSTAPSRCLKWIATVSSCQGSFKRHLLPHSDVHDSNVLRFEPSRARFHKWCDHVHPTPVSIGISLEWTCCVLTGQARSHRTS